MVSKPYHLFMDRKSPIPLWLALSVGAVLLGGIYLLRQPVTPSHQASLATRQLTSLPSSRPTTLKDFEGQDTSDVMTYRGPFFSFEYPSEYAIQNIAMIEEHRDVQGFDHYGYQALDLTSTGVVVVVNRWPYAPGQSATSEEQLARQNFGDNLSG